jgi:hypothetical protein
LQAGVIQASTSPASYALPYGVVGAFNEDNNLLAVGGGTNDVYTKIDYVTSHDGRIRNEKQLIFGFEVPDDGVGPYVRGVTSDFKELSAEAQKGDSDYSLLSTDPQKGWYMPLQRAEGTQNLLDDEYVSAKPVVVGSTMVIATFKQTKVDTDNQNLCEMISEIDGIGGIYVVDLWKGEGKWPGGDKLLEIPHFIPNDADPVDRDGDGAIDGVEVSGQATGEITSDVVVQKNQALVVYVEITGLDNSTTDPKLQSGDTVPIFWMAK